MAPSSPLTPKVSKISFMGTLWGATAVSAVFVICRILVRIKVFRRLWVEDGLVILAWILLLIIAVLWQIHVDALYDQFKLLALEILPTPDILQKQRVYLRAMAAWDFAFYTCLFAIKLSFLFFFRRLGANVHGQRTWWWIVFVLNTAAYISLIGSMAWQCMLKPLEYIFTQCTNTPGLKFQHQTFIYTCAIDAITDALIITIPISLLWKVRLPLRQKLALMGLFSLTVIVMTISVVRVAVTPTDKVNADQTLFFLWANVEMGVAIIISCLASFRQLFMKQERERHAAPAATPQPFRQKLLSAIRPKYYLPTIGLSTFRFSFPRKPQSDARLSMNSKEYIVDLDLDQACEGQSSKTIAGSDTLGRRDTHDNTSHFYSSQVTAR